MKRLDDASFVAALRARATGARSEYKAFYSTFLGGLTVDPHHMIVPLDDHMVHRGDAVFEAVKFLNRKVFALDRHFERLEQSARALDIQLPLKRAELREVVIQTVRASGLEAGLIRLFVSRGPGGFTTNPYESTGAEVYCAVTKLAPPKTEAYQQGVRVGLSGVAVKDGFWARVKSCNYLPNVLMKKEAVDRGFDFVVGRDENGFLTESSTENFAIIDDEGRLVLPPFERILRGVTAVRAMELMPDRSLNRLFTFADIQKSRGAVMLGTTLDVLPVRSFQMDDGVVHEFSDLAPEVRELMKAFAADVTSGPLLELV
ncbi:MAG: aminotransferase class IV [Bdellovibrionales bacterium]|nr:aminotransferase class IV [Bdellovibrionales bacterium]